MSESEILRLLAEMKDLGARLPDLSSLYPLEAPVFGPPASWADVAVLEEQAGASLPADYKEFLQACGPVSAMDFHGGYDFLARPVIRRIVSQSAEVPRAVLRGGRKVSINSSRRRWRWQPVPARRPAAFHGLEVESRDRSSRERIPPGGLEGSVARCRRFHRVPSPGDRRLASFSG